MVAAAGFLLASCAGEDQFVPCPNAAILEDASRITLFKPGGGHDASNLRVEAALYQTMSRCDIDDEGIDTGVWIRGEALVGANSDEREFVIPIFVSVTDKKEKIIQKEVVEIELDFDSDQQRIIFSDWLDDVYVPLPGELLGSDLEVVVGFQLTQEQLEYNRSR